MGKQTVKFVDRFGNEVDTTQELGSVVIITKLKGDPNLGAELGEMVLSSDAIEAGKAQIAAEARMAREKTNAYFNTAEGKAWLAEKAAREARFEASKNAYRAHRKQNTQQRFAVLLK